MILDKIINIRINPSNYNHYTKYYNNIKIKDIISVKIEYLTKGNHSKINIQCDRCGKIKKIDYSSYISYGHKNGNYICRSCNMVKNNQKKYGVDNVFQLNDIKEKSKETIIIKYGVDNVSKSNIIKNKKIKTNNKKLGVDWPMQNKNTLDKSKKTLIEKYNVDNISKLKEIKSKKENTCLKSHGVKYISQSPNFKNIIKTKILNKLKLKYDNLIDIIGDNYEFHCDNCNENFLIGKKAFYTRYNLNVELCTTCKPIGNFSISGEENNLYNFIYTNYNNKILRNNRNVINPYELDIYIPELKLAFEFNGLYWHNELHKENNYHLNKTELCEDNEIQLIHIYEDDWLYKQDIIKSMILNKLGKSINKIYARKCDIREIFDNKLVKEFLDKNHLQGFIGSSVKLGLFYENKLVSLMTFGKRRVAMGKKGSEGEYELLRFCTKLNTNVIGGANKLFKHFVKNYELKEMTTYADRSWSNGNLYKQLGFEYHGKTKPNYHYIVNGIRKYRFGFRKDKLIKEGFDPLSTERQIMIDRKIYRIYDSGNLKFIY